LLKIKDSLNKYEDEQISILSVTIRKEKAKLNAIITNNSEYFRLIDEKNELENRYNNIRGAMETNSRLLSKLESDLSYLKI